MTRSSRWCYTLNNPTDDEEQFFGDFAELPIVKYHVFGREIGDSGTRHLQGFFILSSQQRLSWCRSNVSARAHYERARGSSKQASDYCKKDGDFEEFGSLGHQGQRSDLEVARAWMADFCETNRRVPSNREFADAHPIVFIRHRRDLFAYAQAICPAPVQEEPQLRMWQSDLRDLLNHDPDDRSVDFFVDPEGNTGKSFFARYYLKANWEKTQILSIGKRDDLAHAIDETKSVFFIDVPRGSMEYLQYSVLEMLKDGIVFSPKYESRVKMFQTNVHVIVLCNEQPDMNKLSADRYRIHNI